MRVQFQKVRRSLRRKSVTENVEFENGVAEREQLELEPRQTDVDFIKVKK